MIQKPPTPSFASVNGPSVTFDFPFLKVTRALIVAGGVRPSSASSTPAFPSSSLYLPISSMSFILGTKPAFAVSYSFGKWIIMKRIFFSLSIADSVSEPLLYIGAWAAVGTKCCECPFRVTCCAVRLHLLVERAGLESTRDLQILRLAHHPGNTLWRAAFPAFTI